MTRPTRGHLGTSRSLRITAATMTLAALWLAAQLGMLHLGNSASHHEQHETAEQHYSAAIDVLVVERWIGPFNRGVARHDLGRFDEAATDFAAAAELAPTHRHCMVQLNWAWSLEAAGDTLAGTDKQGSVTRYLEADAVLAGANCPDEATTDQDRQPQQEHVKSTRERLEAKRTGNPPPPDDPQTEPEPEALGQELQDRQEQAQREFHQATENGGGEPPSDGERTW